MGGLRLIIAPLLLSLTGAFGVYLLYTAMALGWVGLGMGPRQAKIPSRSSGVRLRAWMTQAGLAEVPVGQFAAVMGGLFVVTTALTYALFGGVVVAAITGACAATAPVAAYRSQRQRRQDLARESWPRMIEEIRLLTGSVGRSIPQALLDVGRHAPEELRPAFQAAEREWLISTDFARTVAVLKSKLGDPTADTTCETLLVAYEVGGNDLERRLASLAEDRIQDVQGRKDARAKQSGVRFAKTLYCPRVVG